MQSILLIEDHEGARHRLTEVLNRAFVSPEIVTASTLSAARGFISKRGFDLIVLDLSLPDGSGEDFLLEIFALHPKAYVVIASIHDESVHLAGALANGAQGYLLKDRSIEELTENFVGIRDGRPAMTPSITSKLIAMVNDQRIVPGQDAKLAAANDVQIDVLTERETEVLVLLSRGFSRPEIAGFLEISRHTVATHIGKIYEKLEISSRSEAAIYAERAGLV
jgi:DNA-binding NarL/FixJ family response regulator